MDHESQFSLLIDSNEEAFGAISTALEAIGAQEVTRECALAGSQEIGWRQYEVGHERVVLQSETYVGVTLFGPLKLVSRLAAQIGRSRDSGT